MQKKLYTLIALVVILTGFAATLIAYRQLDHYNREVNVNYLKSAAGVIRAELEQGSAVESAGQQMLRGFDSIDIPLRATVIAKDGAVLFDNEANGVGNLDNHLTRPEVREVLAGKEHAVHVRRSSTLKQEMLYFATHFGPQDLVIRVAMPLSSYGATLGNMTVLITLIILAAVVLVTAVAILTTRRITRPLVRLDNAVQAIATGDFSSRVPEIDRTYPEIHHLAQSYNAMAATLEENLTHLEEQNARLDAMINSMVDPLIVVNRNVQVTFMNSHARQILGRDLDPEAKPFPLLLLTHNKETELMVAEVMENDEAMSREFSVSTRAGNGWFLLIASPIAGNDGVSSAVVVFHDQSEARIMQQMRSEFVANVTHELRTPLTSIRGFIETLRGNTQASPEVTARFLDIIDIEAERLDRLIADILSLSEIEVAVTEHDKTHFDLLELIDEVAVLLDEYANENRVALRVPESEEPLMVSASRNRIKQVLINLIDNAIKYNIQGGKVTVSAQRLESQLVRIEVADTGVGIPADQQARVFERFFRVDRSRSRELGGTGLGLSIVKHIAQLYQGRAQVHSTLGQGSTFRVDLKI